ncbi:MAG TPA: MBL fold metallo-hydrolase [Gemmatimonadales bacterium]|jgi:glyoxylase-like metal-dependent hydrolase (beta-lactamase superfamily II)
MFGVVPKPLWSRKIPADERNRIPLTMRCLLIEHPDGLVLLDTALGDKEDDKFIDIYGVENAGNPGPTQLEDALRAAGHEPQDVRWVINTHLHFDHAGGNTIRAVRTNRGVGVDQADGASGSSSAPPALTAAPAVLAFPNATYIVQKNELEFARHTNERTRASYLPHNFEPVAKAGRWKLIEGDVELLPGISTRLTPGHVPWHQSIVLSSGGETAIYLGDLIPTSAHLPLAYIMGYDLEPLRTLESKRTLFREALAGGWLFIFEHDSAVAMGRAVPDGKGVGLGEVVASPRA